MAYSLAIEDVHVIEEEIVCRTCGRLDKGVAKGFALVARNHAGDHSHLVTVRRTKVWTYNGTTERRNGQR